MGYTRHDAIIAVCSSYVFTGYSNDIPVPDVEAFRADLPAEWQHLLIGPIDSATNGYQIFVFLPDGSKEGWGTSDDGDLYRERFLQLFSWAYEDGSSPFDVLVVAARWGGDEPGGSGIMGELEGGEAELAVFSNIHKQKILGEYGCNVTALLREIHRLERDTTSGEPSMPVSEIRRLLTLDLDEDSRAITAG
jgi:hypothetical protein